MKGFETPRPDLEQIRVRIQQKRLDYVRYNFTGAQNDLLRTFFDLAQEFDSLQDFFRACVALPLEFMGLECNLYLLSEDDEQLDWVCSSLLGIIDGVRKVPPHIVLAETTYEAENSLVISIRRRRNCPESNEKPGQEMTGCTILGMLEIFPLAKLLPEDRFFFVKFSNRIAFNLYNRLIARQNVHHLKFINNLVRDIEHNVLIPNIYFKHLFNQLKKKIGELDNLEKTIEDFKNSVEVPGQHCEEIIGVIHGLHEDLQELHKELLNHHANYSLCLESLLRQDHFRDGRFVLHPKSCFIEKEIIAPQLDYHHHRFEARGITIVKPADMLEEEFPITVDVGLLAQVYDNLFSNAAKYATEVINHQGRPKKAMAYGREFLVDYFGPGNDGIKFNVYSTGPRLAQADVAELFSDGFRGEASGQEPGSGHGLSFVKQVVEIHGGRVGYERTREGNNFYFVLPLSVSEPSCR